MKKLLAVMAASLLVVGCAPNDFADDAQKDQAFKRFACERALWLDSTPLIAAQHVRASPESSDEDRLLALQVTMAVQGGGVHSPVPLSASPGGDGVCSGWVWDNYLEHSRAEDYDTFTYERAVSGGYL